MSDKQHVDLLIIGSGEAGKNLAWAMASAGQRVAGLHTRRPNTCSSRRLPSILRPVVAQGANRVQFGADPLSTLRSGRTPSFMIISLPNT